MRTLESRRESAIFEAQPGERLPRARIDDLNLPDRDLRLTVLLEIPAGWTPNLFGALERVFGNLESRRYSDLTARVRVNGALERPRLLIDFYWTEVVER